MTTCTDLLPRDAFRAGGFARDNHECVVCGAPAKDAHHILGRRLFPDGGYCLDNGAALCGPHHLEAEMTTLSVEKIRSLCDIRKPVVPDQLYPDHVYDKWGNHILPSGRRTKGPLADDESVRKILARGGVLDTLTHWVKYPRTFHLPWSGCVHSDDKVARPEWMAALEGQRVIVTEKLDGENTSLYQDHFHARSIDGRHHPSRDWAKNFWGSMRHEIPQGWRLVCENLTMVHSILYSDLPSYLFGLSVWNEKNECLPWDETQEWFAILDLPMPRTLYDGVFDARAIQDLYDQDRDWTASEGYVLRIAGNFHYGAFHRSVMKFVRKDHMQTIKHNMWTQAIEYNGLQSKSNRSPH